MKYRIVLLENGELSKFVFNFEYLCEAEKFMHLAFSNGYDVAIQEIND